MDFSNTQLFSVLAHRISYLAKRQAVLSENIANSDTPHYKARDLEELDFKRVFARQSARVELAVTDSKHQRSKISDGGFKIVSQYDASEVSPSGNNVIVEEQALKMSANNLDYQTATSVYKKMLEMVRLTVGAGGR